MGKKTHGMSRTRPFTIWQGMKNRCYRKGIVNYSRYGGRGIRVCKRWRESFESFWEDMGSTYFKGAQIDRIDSNGNYEPVNCRWVTKKQQASNKRSVKMYTHNGKTMHASDWEKELGLKPGTVRARIKAGWDIKRAITTPKKEYKCYYYDEKRSDKPYRVHVKRGGKQYFVGRFKTRKEAMKAREEFLYQYLINK